LVPGLVARRGQAENYPHDSAKRLENIAGHALVGCASAVAQGGKCGPGALSAGVASSLIGGRGLSVQKLVANAVIGGVASVAAGGNFANGAVTSAFGYLFNECAHGGCTNGPYANNLIPVGSQSQIDQINDALDTLCMNSETACRLIDALRNGPEDVFIRITDGRNYYREAWNTLYYNPNAPELKGAYFIGVPPEIALGHELIHAYHDIRGMMDPWREETSTVGLPSFLDWVRGRSPTGYGPFRENKIRKDYGVLLRPAY
jgi:hypothetical protein